MSGDQNLKSMGLDFLLKLDLPPPLHRLQEELQEFHVRKALRRQYTRRGEVKKHGEPKVFGIGLSKTGTTSLGKALEILGYDTVHWKWRGKVAGWTEFSYFDAVTDVNCSAQFESLFYTFENAKFIYTTRDVDSWVRSIEVHYGAKRPAELRAQHAQVDFWGDTDENWRWHNAIRKVQIQEALYAQHRTWAEAYDAYDRRVRCFFESKLAECFLELNVVGGDHWEPLCAFLGKGVPDVPFPHANKSKP
mgnify:CR=1 FL=1